MKKALLLGLMATCMATSGFALTNGEYVYTPQGRFHITGANTVTNANALSGWTVVTAVEGQTIDANFTMLSDGYATGVNSFQSLDATTTEGMYYKFTPESASGTYVVSYKMKAAALTSVRIKTVDVSTNLVKVEGNADGTYGGTTDVAVANTAEELNTDWQTFNYAIVGDGVNRVYFISFTGMATDIEIADLQIAPAYQVADLRQRDAAIEKVNAYKNVYDWDEDLLEEWGITDAIESLNGVTDETTQDKLDEIIETADDSMAGFLEENMDDFLAGKSDNYLGINTGGNRNGTTYGDWTNVERAYWSSNAYPDLGHYQNGSKWAYGNPTNPMGVYMQKDLISGSYVFAIESTAALREPLKSTWNNDDGLKPAYGIAYIVKVVDDATTDTIVSVVKDLHPVNFTPFIVAAQIDEDGTYEIGYKAYCKEAYQNFTLGSVVYVKDASIWGKTNSQYSVAELTYYADVVEQITVGRTNIETAKENIADATLYWGKTALQDTINVYEPVIADYEAWTQDKIIATYMNFYEKTTSEDIGLMVYEVYQNATKQLIAANRTFTAVNDTLNSLGTAIASAEETLNMRVYEAATGKDALKAAIATAEGVLAQMQTTGYSEENAAIILAAIKTLNEAVDAFKETVPAGTTIVDIDFSNAAVKNDETGSYSISGTKGAMEFSAFSTTDEPQDGRFEQGIWVNGEHLYAGYLRVGNGTGTVTFDPTEDGTMGTNILKVSYELYIQGLSNRSVGVYLKNKEEDASETTVAAFYANYYNNTITDNTFGIELGSLKYGSGGSYDDAAPQGAEGATGTVCAKNTFEFVFDFGEKSMYCTTTSDNGVATTAKKGFDGTIPNTFVLQCNYDTNFGSRRCWFDNLKIERIAAGPADEFVDGIEEVTTAEQTVAPVKKVFKDGRIVINGKYGVNGIVIK